MNFDSFFDFCNFQKSFGDKLMRLFTLRNLIISPLSLFFRENFEYLKRYDYVDEMVSDALTINPVIQLIKTSEKIEEGINSLIVTLKL